MTDLSTTFTAGFGHDRPSSTYLPRAGTIYDEAFATSGVVRPHWREFFQSFSDMRPEEFERRWNQARRLIRDNGVTYNVYGDPKGMDRPWQLDPLPLLVAPDEWTYIQEALQQRARLLDLVLHDLYSEQRLLREGLIPPQLVYAHPRFPRACLGLSVPGNRYLHLYAADLARTAEGAWQVMGDRTQAPSGSGYALENRIVISRTLPDAFGQCRVQRLARFFSALRQSLASLASHRRDNPRIVLLTPGPLNETYFEHAYLARYLGYTLVEGGDLTVRDSTLYLKTLGGLLPVDVVLRRLDDDFCDPLELRPDSFLGVPGLVHAVRSGNVAIANALGSGLTETPALLPFLPRLCQHLLGEPLRMPSAVTWWCGVPSSLDHVLANLRRLVIKPAYPGSSDVQFGEKLSREQLEKLADQIRAQPHNYVAQEQLSLSTVPVWTEHGLQPRHASLRTYVAADRDGYTTMPGGLTRVSAAMDTLVVSMQKGGGSKDTWVLSEGPVDTFSLLPERTDPVELTRSGSDLPSRAADNLYWLGRYVERLDGVMRLMRGIALRLMERQGSDPAPETPVLLRALTTLTKAYPGFVGDDAAKHLANPLPELISMMTDARRAGTVASIEANIRRIAASVRDRLSADAFRILASLGEDAMLAADRRDELILADLLAEADRTIVTLSAFGGMCSESMTRTQGWRFLEMGRRIERSLAAATLVHTTLVRQTAYEPSVLEAVLEIADSIITYRRRYMASLQAGAALDLLLLDESNPRSLAFQLAVLAQHIEQLPRTGGQYRRSTEERSVMSLLSTVRLAEADDLARVGESGLRPWLDELTDQLLLELPALSDVIGRSFLSHTPGSRQMASGRVMDPQPGRAMDSQQGRERR